MAVTLYTVLWSILAIASICSLYFFNKRRGFLAFVTDRKYLFFFLVASAIGMRQHHFLGLLLVVLTFYLMRRDYYPYIKKCRRLKALQEMKH